MAHVFPASLRLLNGLGEPSVPENFHFVTGFPCSRRGHEVMYRWRNAKTEGSAEADGEGDEAAFADEAA